MRRCPVCCRINGNVLSLRPPTAGTRVLKLGGPARTKTILVQFLKEFQTLIGLPRYPLRDQFDSTLR